MQLVSALLDLQLLCLELDLLFDLDYVTLFLPLCLSVAAFRPDLGMLGAAFLGFGPDMNTCQTIGPSRSTLSTLTSSGSQDLGLR